MEKEVRGQKLEVRVKFLTSIFCLPINLCLTTVTNTTIMSIFPKIGRRDNISYSYSI